ncbi:hypothetical protein JCM12296A_55760 [Desulfosarcina cetonica]
MSMAGRYSNSPVRLMAKALETLSATARWTTVLQRGQRNRYPGGTVHASSNRSHAGQAVRSDNDVWDGPDGGPATEFAFESRCM